MGTIERVGEVFGKMALIDSSPRSATAIADEDNAELDVLDRESPQKDKGAHAIRTACSERAVQSQNVPLSMTRYTSSFNYH